MKTLRIFFILILFFSCYSNVDNTDCMDCGGGLLDGFLYKEVVLTDISKLNDIAISAGVGECIRFKMDGDNFDSAEIVESCCCNLFS